MGLLGWRERAWFLLVATHFATKGLPGMTDPKGLVVLKGAAAFAAKLWLARGSTEGDVLLGKHLARGRVIRLFRGRISFLPRRLPTASEWRRPSFSFYPTLKDGDRLAEAQDCIRRFGFAARAKGASSLSRFAESAPSRRGQDWRQFLFVWTALETHLFSSRAESRAHCFGLRRFAGGDFAGAVTTSNCC